MAKLIKQSGAELAAENIKRELQEAFPEVKFSVRTSYIAGASYIDILYLEGPTTKQVEKISKKYQEGRFNPLTDEYEFSNKKFEYGCARYVHVYRYNKDELPLDIF